MLPHKMAAINEHISYNFYKCYTKCIDIDALVFVGKESVTWTTYVTRYDLTKYTIIMCGDVVIMEVMFK